jgi:hypothetical protein
MPNSSDDKRQDSIRFSETIPPGESKTLSYELPDDARIEEVSVRMYRGAELDLEVFPFLEREEGRREPLVTFRGREVVVGDNDHFDFLISQPVRESDEIGIEAEHTGSDFQLDVQVTMVLDYRNGSGSTLSSFLGGLF